MATSVEGSQSGYQDLLCAYQSWNFGEDQSIRFWHTGARSRSLQNNFYKK